MEYLDKEQLQRARECTLTIKDRLQSIMTELALNDKPYKEYILEKAKVIQNDIECIITMCENKE